MKDRIAQLIERKQRGKLVSFDLENAFDRVKRRFLHSTMTSLGFNPRLIELLARIGELSSSRLLVNGHLSAAFPIQRSVRQGDPLSMHLFVLYLHPLVSQLERTCGEDLVVAYADDISVIVTSGSKLERIRDLFSRFELIAGAKLNWGKTISVDVGFIDGNPLQVSWLRTEHKTKILGVIYANSIRLMVTLNWDVFGNKIRSVSLAPWDANTHAAPKSDAAEYVHYVQDLVPLLYTPALLCPHFKTDGNDGNVLVEPDACACPDATVVA